MHHCILKSHLSVEHRENYSQNTVRKLFHKIFSKISLSPKLCISFARTSFLFFLNSPKFCTQKLTSPTLCPPHTTALYPPLSRILFLHFYRCTYPVTVDRRLLATSVSCPHLPSPLAIRLTPPKNPRRAPSRRTPPNSPQIKIPPHLQTPFPAKKNPAPSSNAISRKKNPPLIPTPEQSKHATHKPNMFANKIR